MCLRHNLYYLICSEYNYNNYCYDENFINEKYFGNKFVYVTNIIEV